MMPRSVRWVAFAVALSLSGVTPAVTVFAQEDQAAPDSAMDAPAADHAAPDNAMSAAADAAPAPDADGAPGMVTSDGENVTICVRVVRSSSGTVTTQPCPPDQ